MCWERGEAAPNELVRWVLPEGRSCCSERTSSMPSPLVGTRVAFPDCCFRMTEERERRERRDVVRTKFLDSFVDYLTSKSQEGGSELTHDSLHRPQTLIDAGPSSSIDVVLSENERSLSLDGRNVHLLGSLPLRLEAPLRRRRLVRKGVDGARLPLSGVGGESGVVGVGRSKSVSERDPRCSLSNLLGSEGDSVPLAVVEHGDGSSRGRGGELGVSRLSIDVGSSSSERRSVSSTLGHLGLLVLVGSSSGHVVLDGEGGGSSSVVEDGLSSSVSVGRHRGTVHRSGRTVSRRSRLPVLGDDRHSVVDRLRPSIEGEEQRCEEERDKEESAREAGDEEGTTTRRGSGKARRTSLSSWPASP